MGIIVLLLVLGIPLIGVLVLVMGIVALVRINGSGGALRGRGLAVAAIVLGGLMLLGTPVLGLAGFFLFARAAPPRPVDEVVITTDVTRKEPPAFDEGKKRDIFKSPATGAEDE